MSKYCIIALISRIKVEDLGYLIYMPLTKTSRSDPVPYKHGTRCSTLELLAMTQIPNPTVFQFKKFPKEAKIFMAKFKSNKILK